MLHTFLGILMEAWGLEVCRQFNVINIIGLKIYVYRKTANLHHFSLDMRKIVASWGFS